MGRQWDQKVEEHTRLFSRPEKFKARIIAAHYLGSSSRIMTFPGVTWGFEKEMIDSGWQGEFITLEGSLRGFHWTCPWKLKVIDRLNEADGNQGKRIYTAPGLTYSFIDLSDILDRMEARERKIEGTRGYTDAQRGLEKLERYFGGLDGAWLDTCSKLSLQTIRMLARFPRLLRQPSYVMVSILAAREASHVLQWLRARRVGSLDISRILLLSKTLGDAEPLSIYRYEENSPMLSVVFRVNPISSFSTIPTVSEILGLPVSERERVYSDQTVKGRTWPRHANSSVSSATKPSVSA